MLQDIIAQLLLGVIFVITFFVSAFFAAQWNGRSDAVLGCLIVAAVSIVASVYIVLVTQSVSMLIPFFRSCL